MYIPVLIPAYNPDTKLLNLVAELKAAGFVNIIIVDDGSDFKAAGVFECIKKQYNCVVIKHAVNLGKGRALKTGLNYCYTHFEDCPGVITADSDGQHLVNDIISITLLLEQNPNCLIIGKRNFNSGTPLRSYLGNVLTKYVFSTLVGIKINDTQSGLRGIPKEFIPRILALDGERYDYEINVLINTKINNVPIIEKDISTIYINNNKSSHFNPVLDSLSIYFLILRFTISSVLTALIDFVSFSLTYWYSSKVFFSIILARSIAGTFNFYINRNIVFKSERNIFISLLKYASLVLTMSLITYLIMNVITNSTRINIVAAKIFTELLLFIINFVLQRDFVFQRKLNYGKNKLE
jgi:putative flippase GtrA